MRISRCRFLSAAIALILAGMPIRAGALLEPVPAPEWKIHTWLNGMPGPLASHQGKVVIVGFFQMLCPASDRFSIPLLNRWQETYDDLDDVLIVGIHSVFENHLLQTPDLLARFIEERGIRYPVGIDEHKLAGDGVPLTMDRFEAEGTPQLVIIDKQGEIVFSQFGGFDPAPVESFIERLVQEKAQPRSGGARTAPSPGKTPRGPSGKKARGPVAEPPPPPPPPPKAQAPSVAPQEGEINVEASGTYKFSFEQSEKSCGELIPAMDVLAEVTIYQDKVELRSTRPFLGLRTLIAEFDPASGRFQTSTAQQSRESGVEIDLKLELSGSIDTDAQPPSLQYEFAVEKRGSEPGWECQIDGRGQGQLSIPRRR